MPIRKITDLPEIQITGDAEQTKALKEAIKANEEWKEKVKVGVVHFITHDEQIIGPFKITLT